MEYTAKQIENAKRNYNSMLRIHTLADYDVENIGRNTAEQRMDYHNRIVSDIRNGNKELEKEIIRKYKDGEDYAADVTKASGLKMMKEECVRMMALKQ